LERLPERRKESIRILSVIDFCPVYFLDAVDGSMYTKQNFYDEGIYEYEDWRLSLENSHVTTKLGNTNMMYWQRPVTMGEFGCAISHYMIWKQSYKMNHNRVLIFEDDIILDCEILFKSLSIYDKFSENNICDIFYLSCLPFVDKEQVTDNIVKCEFSYLLHSYILTKSAIQVLINANFLSNLIAVDEFVPLSYGDGLREDLKDLYTFTKKLSAYRLKDNIVGQTDSSGSQTAFSQRENQLPSKDGLRRLFE
jgi:collagen beta-1,O-galactosyltransferase